MMQRQALKPATGGYVMLVRLSLVACLAFGGLLLGGYGIALAGSDDGYGGAPEGSDAGPPPAEQPDAADDGAASPDDSGGGDAGPPPSGDDQPE
jgi:hypothetical protein